METKFVTTDEFGIGTKLPYIAVKLTADQAKAIKGKEAEIYSTDGHRFFIIRDLELRATGDFMIYVVFK